jgi:hypothetical protein
MVPLDYLVSSLSQTDLMYRREHEHDREPSGPARGSRSSRRCPSFRAALGTIDRVIESNDEFQRKALMKLERRQRGSFFDPATDHEETQCARERAGEILASEPAEPSGLIGSDSSWRSGLRLRDRSSMELQLEVVVA